MKYQKREDYKVVISKEQHKYNTMQAAKKRRMNKKRGKLASKLADKPLTQVLQDAMKDLGLDKNK